VSGLLTFSIFFIVDKSEQDTVFYIWPFILIHNYFPNICKSGPEIATVCTAAVIH